MTENSPIFGGFRGVGSSQPVGRSLKRLRLVESAKSRHVSSRSIGHLVNVERTFDLARRCADCHFELDLLATAS